MECEIPLRNATSEEIESIFNQYDTVSVVALSTKPAKDSNIISQYLKDNGFTIIPVHPSAQEILGKKAYPSLKDIPHNVQAEIVCVFRPSDEVNEIVDDAISVSAKVIWMQLGIANNTAADKARSAGLQVVMNKCMKVEHKLWLNLRRDIPA